MENQLFENVSRPTSKVGNKKTQRYMWLLSILLHSVVLIITWITITSPVIDKTAYTSKYVVSLFSGPVYFYDPKPPPPLLEKSPADKKPIEKQPSEQRPKQSQEKIPEIISPIPIEAPSEVKPEPPQTVEPNSSGNTSSNEESVVVGGSSGGVRGGVRGGVPNGVIGKSPSARGSSPMIEEPVRVGGSIKSPKRIRYSRPEYPPDAISAHIHGVVIVEAIIDKNGKIRSAKIIKSIPLLDSAALEAVKKWEYVPMTLGGKAVEVLLTVIINFDLTP